MTQIAIRDLARRLDALEDRRSLVTASHRDALAWDELDPWVGALVDEIGGLDGRGHDLTIGELRAYVQRLARVAGPDGLLDARELAALGERWGGRVELGAATRTVNALVGAFERQPPQPGSGLRNPPVPRRPEHRIPTRSPPGGADASPSSPLAGTRYASYDEPLHRWDESFWPRQPSGPRRDDTGMVRENYVQLALQILKDRYPAGYDLVRRARSDPEFADMARRVFREPQYDARGSQTGWRTQLTYREHADNLSTLVHESGHIVANRFGAYRQNGFDWGGDNQHPMPPLRNNVPMKAIAGELEPEDRTLFRSKVRNYLDDPANPGRAIGTLSIDRLLEETIQYETGLLTAYAVADRTLGDTASNDRTGLMTMMRYLATYLGHVRQESPAMYRELTESPEWSDLILRVWARGEHALALTRRQKTVNLRGQKLDESDYRKHRQGGYSVAPRLPEAILRQPRYMNEIRAFERAARG